MSRALTLRAQLADAAAALCVQLASNEALTSTAGCTAPQALRHRSESAQARKNAYSLLLYCVHTANLHRFRAESCAERRCTSPAELGA